MQLLRHFTIILIVSIISTTSLNNLQAKEKYGYVTVKKLFIRSKPGLKGKKLGSLTVGDKITIIEKSSKKETIAGKKAYWYKFTFGKKKGWVFGGFISDTLVYPKEMLMKILKGTYVYYNKPGGYQSRLLIIKGNTYIERWYDSYYGISDEFSGTVIYQAYDIILVPKTRKGRPSVYIDYPKNSFEESIYVYAYKMYDDDPNRLYKLKRLKVKDGYKKLMIMIKKGKIFLVSPKRKKEIESKKITNVQKMFPAYKRY
jgi:hypothetical protein